MASRPNILWLLTDEQRCDSLGCYGSPWARTPNLDALVNDGVLFENALTPAPVCLPARTSLMSGRYPSQTGVWDNNVDSKTPVSNLMDSFHDAGYRSASFGKHHYCAEQPAFQHQAGPSLSTHVHYFHYGEEYDEATYDVVKYPGNIYNWIFGGRFPASAEETAEADVVRKAKQWLESNPGDNPFFLRVSFNGPHTPVVPPEPFDRLIDPEAIDLPAEAEPLPHSCSRWLSEELAICSDSSVLSPEQIRRMRQCYYGEVAFLDSLFGDLLDWMKQRGLLENTIVAYWCDHGTHLGDYGLVQKQTFFEPVVNVPFFFWYPAAVAKGIHVHTPVETQSLLPTLLDLAGLESRAGCAPSLASALRSGNDPKARPVFSEFTLRSFAPHTRHEGRLVLVRDGNWKLSACLDPSVHDVALYDLECDPYERTNLAGDSDCARRRKQLLTLLEEHVSQGA